jgi:DsbC/DsbD-like thiol-disulfide interchange protein
MRIAEGGADVMQSPMLKRVLAGALWIAWLGAAAAAAGPDDLLGPPARVSLTANAETTPRGWMVRLAVTPVKGVHVYSPGNEGYIGVSVSLDLPSGLKTLDPRFPQGDPYMFGALKELVTVYDKPFEIRQDVVRTGKGPQKLPATVPGTLRYQACTDKICFPPQEHSFEVTLEQPAARSPHQ